MTAFLSERSLCGHGSSLLNSYRLLFENWELKHVREIVRQFQRQYKVLRNEETEDLLQECLTRWFFVRDRYEPERKFERKTFMSAVMENHLLNIIERQSRQKRKVCYESIPLDEILHEGEDLDAYSDAFIVEDKGFENVLRSDLPEVLARVIMKLPRRQRELCRLVRSEGLSLNKVGQRLNLSNGALYEEIIRIREVFREEGLMDYLKK